MIETRVLPVAGAARGLPARLAVHLCGKGPLAVLVHGYPLDHRMWLEVLQSEVAQRRTLCAIDLRGHGRSPWAGDEVHSMELLADDVAAVIRMLASDGKADVCGLSMGGYVALALWARQRALVRSLLLCDTKAGADSPEARAGRDAAIATVVEKGRRAIADAMLGKLLAPGADVLLRARVQSMIEGTPVETFVADLRGMKERSDRVAMLGEITVPTLVVVGELDPITPVGDAKIMATGVKGARLEVVPGAAHMTPMEQPSAFAALCASLWT